MNKGTTGLWRDFRFAFQATLDVWKNWRKLSGVQYYYRGEGA